LLSDCPAESPECEALRERAFLYGDKKEKTKKKKKRRQPTSLACAITDFIP